jgi:hypothetical protein
MPSLLQAAELKTQIVPETGIAGGVPVGDLFNINALAWGAPGKSCRRDGNALPARQLLPGQRRSTLIRTAQHIQARKMKKGRDFFAPLLPGNIPPQMK